jgi:RNA polymerase sigma-70 factor (ECF subfamily)
MSAANDHSRLSRCEGAPDGSVQAAIDPAQVAALFAEHGAELRRFVLGVVRDPELAGDVVQASFARAVERGHTARAETIKGWLFQVAFREALTARRRLQSREQATRRFAGLGFKKGESPEEGLIRQETIAAVRQALDELPEEQSRVVWARMYDDKTFAEIAKESGLPLGTVLTRMRLGLEKLKRILGRGEDSNGVRA